MSKQLKIMFVPMEFVGHVTSGLGLAQMLQTRGHQIVYAINKSQIDLVNKYGFDIKLIDSFLWRSNSLAEFESRLHFDASMMQRKTWINNQLFRLQSGIKFILQYILHYYYKDYQLEQLIGRIKPDILIVDDIQAFASVVYSGKPWVWINSPNPLGIMDDDGLPPPLQGYATDQPRTRWKIIKNITRVLPIYNKLYSLLFFLRGYGLNHDTRNYPSSPYLNLYGYPKELCYGATSIFKNSYRLDTFVNTKAEQKSELPQKLKEFIEANNKSKLIYVSLGSYGSGDVSYMKKLVRVLSRSKHKFIVSKGYFHDKYNLYDNMWGDRYLPQTQILPLVDLVITNGGNNTVLETFSLGKPMIVIPIYTDQFDNAQRIHELNYGIKLNMHDITEKQLLDAIEQLLHDDALKKKLDEASRRIQSTDRLTRASELIESLIN